MINNQKIKRKKKRQLSTTIKRWVKSQPQILKTSLTRTYLLLILQQPLEIKMDNSKEKKEEIISLDGRLFAERKRKQRRHGSKMD